MKFPETTTYEVWEARGGAEPKVCYSMLTKELADAMADDLRRGAAAHARAEAARFYYMVVAATTTRREVHG